MFCEVILLSRSYGFFKVWDRGYFCVFVIMMCISTEFFCYSSRIIIRNTKYNKNEKYESAGTVLEYLSFLLCIKQ